MDIITQLPKSGDGFDAVMVVVDFLTKLAHFMPTSTTISATGAAHEFLIYVLCYHGLPVKIISDKDLRLVSSFWQAL